MMWVLAQHILTVSLLVAQMASRDASLSSALSELNEGRILTSIQQFKQIVQNDPANGQAWFYLATVYTHLNAYPAAERYLQRAMELNPNQGAHYYQFGVIRYRQKQWPAALEFLKRALELGAGNYEAATWRTIGDVQLELFDRDAALQAYEASLRLQPQDSTARLALARLYLDRNETEQAIAQLRKALEIDPSLKAAYSTLGRAYRQAGDLPSAVAVLKKALESDAADQESRYAYGQVLLAMDRIDDGRKELEKYETIRQQIVTANRNYENGIARLEAGAPSDAEKLLRKSVRLAPKYGPALNALGALLLDRGSPGQAAEFLKRAVEANPLNADSWFSLASAYLKLGKFRDALEAANTAIVLDDEQPRYQLLAGEIQTKIRRGRF
jgi:tetratricopeptide (TPR) repeat protein